MLVLFINDNGVESPVRLIGKNTRVDVVDQKYDHFYFVKSVFKATAFSSCLKVRFIKYVDSLAEKYPNLEFIIKEPIDKKVIYCHEKAI